LWNKVRAFFELIKFEHTVFALPFAYLGTLLALGGRFEGAKFFWVTLAMVGARTAGMTLNRIVDLSIDRDNPRTKNRPLLTGAFSLRGAWIAAAAGCGLLFLSAWMLNPLCLKLSPIALILLSSYHYVKRFSALCHFALGLVLAVAPMGGWIAVTGSFSWLPVPLALAVLFWVAGFDIIYSLQDMDFDRTHGLHSIPAKFGQKTALLFAGYCHIATVVFLAVFGLLMQLGILYWAGAAATAGLLFFEHKLLEDTDLNRINTAFFTINGWVGILLFIFTFLDTFR
jgi:4-hydroxybenzoate polyprenyltransferase